MRTLAIIILLCVSARAAEVWLTKERAEQLRALKKRPHITKKVLLGNGMEEFHWYNGYKSWVTTQEVRRVAGAKAAHGWQKKLDAEKAARKEIIDNIKALATKGSATKKELDALAAKTEKQQETKERQP